MTKVTMWDFSRIKVLDLSTGSVTAQSSLVLPSSSASSGVANVDLDGNFWTVVETTGFRIFAKLVWDTTTANGGTWTYHGPLWDALEFSVNGFIASTVVKIGNNLVAFYFQNSDNTFHIKAWDDSGVVQWDYPWTDPTTLLFPANANESGGVEELRTDGTRIFWGMEGGACWGFDAVAHNSDPYRAIDLNADTAHYFDIHNSQQKFSNFRRSNVTGLTSLNGQTDGVDWTIVGGTGAIFNNRAKCNTVTSNYCVYYKLISLFFLINQDLCVEITPNGDKSVFIFNAQNQSSTAQGLRLTWNGTDGGTLEFFSNGYTTAGGTVVATGFMPNLTTATLRILTDFNTPSCSIWVNGTLVLNNVTVPSLPDRYIGFGSNGTAATFNAIGGNPDSGFRADVDLQGFWVDSNYIYAWGSSDESYLLGQYPTDRIWAFKGHIDGSGWTKIGSSGDPDDWNKPGTYRSFSGTGVVVDNIYYLLNDRLEPFLSSFDLNTGAYIKRAVDLHNVGFSALVAAIIPPVAPVITGTLGITGLVVSPTISVTEVSAGPFDYEINWGDGTTTSSTTTSKVQTFNHTYSDTTPKTITVYVIDNSTSLRSNTLLLYPTWGSLSSQRTDFYPRHTAQRA